VGLYWINDQRDVEQENPELSKMLKNAHRIIDFIPAQYTLGVAQTGARGE
jgi:hypothetical protein